MERGCLNEKGVRAIMTGYIGLDMKLPDVQPLSQLNEDWEIACNAHLGSKIRSRLLIQLSVKFPHVQSRFLAKRRQIGKRN